MRIEIPGCDEYNLAIFPIFSLSGHSTVPGQTTLEFEAPVVNPKTGRTLKRRLIVSSKEAGRLPLERDDLLLMGLMSLTMTKNGFADPVVTFTRVEIMRLLDWDTSKSYYDFLHHSLQLWRDIKLTYIAAWFNHHTGTHHNLAFQFLGDVWTEAYDDGSIKGYTIVWNHTLFTALQKGILRHVDMGLYRQLPPAARRIYRFLHLNGPSSVDYQVYELYQFARHHVGLTEKCSKLSAECKRVLKPSFEALESHGVIEPSSPTERYRKRAIGGWEVHIRLKATDQTAPALPAPNREPEASAVRADEPPPGVDPECVRILEEVDFPGWTGKFIPKVIFKLATGRTPAYLSQKVKNIQMACEADKVESNPWGLLRGAIENDYEIPIKPRRVPKTQQTLKLTKEEPETPPDVLCKQWWDSLKESEQRDWTIWVEDNHPEKLAEIERVHKGHHGTATALRKSFVVETAMAAAMKKS